MESITLQELRAQTNWEYRIGEAVTSSTITVAGTNPAFALGGSNFPNNLTLHSNITLQVIGGTAYIGTNTISPRARTTSVLTLKSGATGRFGTEESRTTWIQGRQGDNRAETPSATLVGEAGSVTSFYLSSMTLGAVTVNLTGGGSSTGTIDLSASTVEAFDISGDAAIGAALAGSYGHLILPKVNARIGGNLTIGASLAGSTGGTVTLNDTRLTLEGNVTVAATGQMKITISGESAAGLVLGESSTLGIAAKGTHGGDANAGLHFVFTLAGTDHLIGLTWEGDKVALLQGFLDDYSITFDIQGEGYAPTIYYDAGTNQTRLAIASIPEAGALSLLPLGWLLICYRRRKP